MAGSDSIAEVLRIALGADDDAAAAGDRLRQADGAEMYALGEAGGNHEACAARALRAERMCLVDDQGGSAPLADLNQLGQRRDVAVGAVEAIHGDETGTRHAERAVERLGIVVTKGDRGGASADNALVQRDVRLHVEVDGRALGGERLDEADVGGVARGAKHGVLGLHERGDALLKAPG